IIGAYFAAKRSGNQKELARQSATSLGLDFIEGIEAYRAYYIDTGQAQILAGVEKMPPFWRKLITSGAWWRLAGARRGVRVAVTLESRGKNQTTYTVVRAFYPRELDFELRISKEGIPTKIGKALFGLQDVEVGSPEFDPFLRVKATDTGAAQRLLGPSEPRQALLAAIQAYPAMVADRRHVSWEICGSHLKVEELEPVLDSLAAVAAALGGPSR
ncbi:MAG: hypothetical protein Q8M76_14195, partial [Spirochaetaceae bacterium]|nr:hypothetical protein [Spirochaetaceae bacterium]